MSEIEDITNELKRAIVESDEYKEFRRLTEIIEKYPDIRRDVDDYRRENFFYQYSDDVGDVMSATEDLQKRYENVKKQPYVERYLRAEMCVCRMVQEICNELMKAVEFDMDFLHDEF
jgi:cell fate (sporulation/competence/biofilm development) regulator YlbF (YheA/YmcA/DUF963 family)